jgi:hypothetical protein
MPARAHCDASRACAVPFPALWLCNSGALENDSSVSLQKIDRTLAVCQGRTCGEGLGFVIGQNQVLQVNVRLNIAPALPRTLNIGPHKFCTPHDSQVCCSTRNLGTANL